MKNILLILLLSFWTLISYSQTSSQPTLEESESWFVGKLINYSENGQYQKEITPKGDLCPVNAKKFIYEKPEIKLVLFEDKIQIFETFEIWERYTCDDGSAVNKWRKKENLGMTFTYIPFKFLNKVSYDYTNKTLTLSCTANRIDHEGDRLKEYSIYYDINGESNLLSRLQKAIDRIQEFLKPKEVF